MVEKTIDINVKVSLQPPLEIKKIDSKCPKNDKSTKKNKDKANGKY